VPGKISSTKKISSNGIAGIACVTKGTYAGANINATVTEKTKDQKKNPKVISMAENSLRMLMRKEAIAHNMPAPRPIQSPAFCGTGN
jgi:hypothetical protein